MYPSTNHQAQSILSGFALYVVERSIWQNLTLHFFLYILKQQSVLSIFLALYFHLCAVEESIPQIYPGNLFIGTKWNIL